MSKTLGARLGAIAAALILLAGCADSSDTSLESTPSESSSSSTTVSPELSAPPTHNSVVIPACDALVSEEVVKSTLGPLFVLFPGDAGGWREAFSSVMGPSAQAAFSEAEQESYCLWAMQSSDGANPVLIAELPADVREKFISELRTSDFVESEVSGLPAFVWESDIRLGARYVWYGFAGDVVVASLALHPDGSLGGPVLEAVHAANE